jgi:hypothetical protein
MKNKYQADGATGKYFILDGEGDKTTPFSVTLTADQEKERTKNNKEIDRHNTAFATPAQCPGLFKYGLELNPIIYARAMSLADGAIVDGADVNNVAIQQSSTSVPTVVSQASPSSSVSQSAVAAGTSPPTTHRSRSHNATSQLT